jgi:hypothetical protein
MLQQITITSDASIAILPLIQAALERELRVLTLGVQRTYERLQGFENRFKMSSQDFEQRFNAGQMGDDLDIIEWAGEIKTYSLLKAQLHALQGAKLN